MQDTPQTAPEGVLSRAQVLERWPLLDPPGSLVTAGAMDPEAVAAAYSSPWAFPRMCEVVYEADESVNLLDPTSMQYVTLDFIHRNLWAYIVKFRQAKITTIVSRIMLRDCMFIRGMKGLLVAERDDTARDIFEGILFSYRNLPPELQAPLAEKTTGGVTQLRFWHGGSIKIQTSGGKSPAIGRGLGWLHITEFGEAMWQRRAATNILPTVAKRKKARVIIETTPGSADSYSEKMWHEALDESSASKFAPLFLRWWEDPSCTDDGPAVASPEMSLEEAAYLAAHEKISPRALAFRRTMLATVFNRDSRLFASKYPSDPYDGWLGASEPILPEEELKAALALAVGTVPAGPVMAIGTGLVIDPTHPYVITADPAGFGASGDPSSLIVWDALDKKDVAMWTGREDPARFAGRLLRTQKLFTTQAGPALISVESNASACIAVLRESGAQNLLWTSKDHPGWYATMVRTQEAEGLFVRMLRERSLTVRNRPTLHQLLKYDGSHERRATGPDGIRHHFDLARCVIMAADVLGRRYFAAVKTDKEVVRIPGSLCIADLDRTRESDIRRRLDPTMPPPRW